MDESYPGKSGSAGMGQKSRVASQFDITAYVTGVAVVDHFDRDVLDAAQGGVPVGEAPRSLAVYASCRVNHF